MSRRTLSYAVRALTVIAAVAMLAVGAQVIGDFVVAYLLVLAILTVGLTAERFIRGPRRPKVTCPVCQRRVTSLEQTVNPGGSSLVLHVTTYSPCGHTSARVPQYTYTAP